MNASKSDYFASLSAELQSQEKRVRQLIGSAHWGHDGRHKELLLSDVIRRHCPPTVLVSTGFVVSPVDFEMRSFEQDILILDTSREAPLFHQGGLVVAFPHTVVAAISVKTTMDSGSLDSVVRGLQSVRAVALDAGVHSQKTWCAGFFYGVSANWIAKPLLAYENLRDSITAHPVKLPVIDDGSPHIKGPNFIGDSSDMALIVDYERNGEDYVSKIRGYNCGQLSTSVFLACLLEHVSLQMGPSPSIFTDLVTEINIPQLDPAVLAIP